MTERVEIQYKGFQIIAAHFKGKFQGRAYLQGPIKRQFEVFKLSATAADTSAVVADLKIQVDRWLTENEKEVRAIREERHRQFLDSRGIKYQGVRTSTKIRVKRVTHCYSCKHGLDNAIDTECVACSWILCDCGACGCGWQGRWAPEN